MTTLHDGEYYFWAASRLRLAQRSLRSAQRIEDAYVEVASLESTTDSPLIRARCLAAMETVDSVSDDRFTSEPFFDDLYLA